MTDTAFEKLTAMWRSGEINDDEFKLATQYLREEQAKAGASSGQRRQAMDRSSTTSPRLATQLARLLMPPAILQGLAPWQRHLFEIGLFMAVAGVGTWLIGKLVLMALIADIEGSWNVNLLGAAGLTLLILATGGMLVGYDRRILGVVSVPLFLVLLFAPLWKSGEPASPPARHSATASQLSALEKMEAIFQGGYSRDEIGALVDATLRNLGSLPTENTRERLGDMLVALRKDGNVQEMEILRCMHATGPIEMELAYAAAACATMLEAK